MRSDNLIRGFTLLPALFKPEFGEPYWRLRSDVPVMLPDGTRKYVWGDWVLDPHRGCHIGIHTGGVTQVTFGIDHGQRYATYGTQPGDPDPWELAPADADGSIRIRTYLEIRPTLLIMYSGGSTGII